MEKIKELLTRYFYTIYGFLAANIGPFLRGISKIIKNSNAGSQRPSCTPPSLINVGANCYLNSAFQGISACDTFVKEIDALCSKNSDGKLSKLKLFKELIDILNGHLTGRMEISRNPIFRNWNQPGQQDSYELLAYAINQVYNELRAHMEHLNLIPYRDLPVWLEQSLPMRFLLDYKIRCKCNNITHSPLQSDLAFHVTIPKDQKNLKLSTLMDLYFAEDLIDDYVCYVKDCTESSAYRLARLRKPLPRTICIHLQRTYWNGYRMVKLNNQVSFDETLTIKPEYCTDKESLENFVTEKEINEYKNRDEEIVIFAKKIVEDVINQCMTSLNGKYKNPLDESLQVINTIKKEDVKVTVFTEEENIEISQNHSKILDHKTEDLHCDTGIDEKRCNEISCVMKPDSEDHKPFDVEGVIPTDQSLSTDVQDDIGRLPGLLLSHENNVDSYNECILGQANINNEGSIPQNDIYATNVDEKGEKNEEYKLVSVIVHSGTVEGGHYICYKCVDDRWFLTNDSYVKEVPKSDVMKSQAYILFYEQPY